MANVSRVKGFVPVMSITGAEWGDHVRKYAHSASDAVALYVGDVVTLDTAHTVTSTSGGAGVACVKAATAGSSVILGVVVGFEVNRAVAATEHPGYLPASTEGYVLVAVGPDVIYEVQEDNIGNDLALTDVGSVGDFVAGAGSATTGMSGHVLDSSDVRANTSGHQFQLIGLANRPDNATGTYGKWLVRISKSQFKLGL